MTLFIPASAVMLLYSYRGRMFPYIQISKESIELILGVHIVVVLQHIQGQTFAKTMGTNKEEEPIRTLYQWDERGFIHVIIIITTDNREVHHAIRQQSAI